MWSCIPQLHLDRLEVHACHSLSEKGDVRDMRQVIYTTYTPFYIGLGEGGVGWGR